MCDNYSKNVVICKCVSRDKKRDARVGIWMFADFPPGNGGTNILASNRRFTCVNVDWKTCQFI